MDRFVTHVMPAHDTVRHQILTHLRVSQRTPYSEMITQTLNLLCVNVDQCFEALKALSGGTNIHALVTDHACGDPRRTHVH